MIEPWRPTTGLHRAALGELYQFGRWVVLGNIFGFLSLQLDNISVGRLLGAPTLGLYEMAFRMSQLSATLISQTASTTAFPALSSVSDKREDFRALYLRMVWILISFNFVVSGLLMLAALWLITMILGDRWIGILMTVRLLSVAGFLRSIVTVASRMFSTAGHPRYDAVINAARLVALASALYPCIRLWGMEGEAIAVNISMAVLLPMYFVMLRRAPGISFLDHLRFVRPE